MCPLCFVLALFYPIDFGDNYLFLFLFFGFLFLKERSMTLVRKGVGYNAGEVEG